MKISFSNREIPIALLAILLFAGAAFLFLNHKTKDIRQTENYSLGSEGQRLESYYQNKKDYDDSFAKAGDVPKIEISAGITSHHFLARDLIAGFFAGIDPRKVKRVVLVGPDHFHNFSGEEKLAYVSRLGWKTPFGDVEPDQEVISDILTNAGDIQENNISFFTEHSVYTLVPFLKYYLPEAKIIPLIVRNDNRFEKTEALGKKIRQKAGDGSILVVSSDFSHEASVNEAKVADGKSINALDNLSIQNVGNINCDCRNCLALMSGFLDGSGEKFTLLENKTSADFGSREEKVTSYVSGYYNSRRQSENGKKLFFVGDMMFDRYVREGVNKYGKGNYNYIFEPVKDKLAQFDLVIGNLEGPITGKKSVSQNTKMDERNNFVFTFDPAVAGVLAGNNIKLVNLGNNHILNQGEEGLAETKKYLDEAGVAYFGYPVEIQSPYGDWISKTVGGVVVAFVGYNYSESGSAEKAIEEIRSAKNQSDIAIVLPHWGVEYKTGDPGAGIRTLAHRFIDEGADAIIGTHPHVIQMSEEYKGKKIYYSLSNFVFDQYFQKETMEGLGVEMTIQPDQTLEYNEVRFVMNKRGQTEIK